jgi:hypothetical protein
MSIWLKSDDYAAGAIRTWAVVPLQTEESYNQGFRGLHQILDAIGHRGTASAY